MELVMGLLGSLAAAVVVILGIFVDRVRAADAPQAHPGRPEVGPDAG